MTATGGMPSSVALEGILLRGREALETGDLEVALRTFDDALRMRPAYGPAWRAKGLALRLAGDPRSALSCYVESLQRAPHDAASWFGLALTLRELGRRDEEIEAYEEALKLDPGHLEAGLNRGASLHEAGRYEEALAAYDDILGSRSDVAGVWNNRGAALLRLGRFEEALEAFDEALALDPGFEDAATNREAALAAAGRDGEPPRPYAFPRGVPLPRGLEARLLSALGLPAVAAWRRARAEGAEDYATLGTALLDDGNPLAAMAAFRKATALGLGPVGRLGRVLAAHGTGRGFEEESEAALAAYPDSVRLAVTIARLRQEGGDLEGAASALETFLAHRPDLPWLWRWKGSLEMRLGRPREAADAYRAALASSQEDALTLANLGAALHRAGYPEEALEMCGRAVSEDEGCDAAWNNLGVVLESLGRGEEARRAFRRCAGPAAPVARANEGASEEARGEFRRAARAYENALDLVPGDSRATAGRRRALGHLGQRARKKRERMIARLERVPGVKRATARRVLDAGFDTPAKIRGAGVAALRRGAGLSAAQARGVVDAFS